MTASIPIRFFANVYLREDWTRLQDKADLLLDGNQVDGLLTRLRFGMEFRDTTQSVSGGIRVSAGEAPNPAAPFVRLADGFRPVTFGLDQFYVDVRPFKNKERVRGVFGKMPQPFWRGDKGVVRAEMTWDDDISPVGATLNTLLVKKNDKDGKPVTTLENVAGYFIVEWFRQARFSGLVGDTSLWADQLKLKVHRVTLGAAYYHWQNLNSGARTPSFVPGQSASLLPGQSAFLLRPGFQETNAIYDLGSGVYVFRKNEFDLPRNLVDDALVGLQGLANGKEFRTPPLMGIGKVGPPFLHDARVFLSKFTRDTYPAGPSTRTPRSPMRRSPSAPSTTPCVPSSKCTTCPRRTMTRRPRAAAARCLRDGGPEKSATRAPTTSARPTRARSPRGTARSRAKSSVVSARCRRAINRPSSSS